MIVADFRLTIYSFPFLRHCPCAFLITVKGLLYQAIIQINSNNAKITCTNLPITYKEISQISLLALIWLIVMTAMLFT